MGSINWNAVTAVAAIGATIAASYYAWLTHQLLEGQRDQTHLESAPILHFGIKDFRRCVINIGRGPALNVVVTNENGEFVGVPAIGGIAAGAESRLPVGVIEQTIHHAHHIYYQDLWGGWHRTEFVATTPQQDLANVPYRVTIQRNLRPKDVPRYAIEHADTTPNRT